MCHWKKWIWPGFLTIAALSLLALWMKTDFIQNDLTAKATSALSSNGQSWASVEMDGRDATIRGDAPSEAAQLEAARLTDTAYEVRVVDNQTGLLAAQSPYILKATRDGDAVELTGFVPNEQMRSTIVASATEAMPGTKITDSMTLARGAPESLAAMAGFGFTQLFSLSKGEMGLSDSNLSVKGQAPDRDIYNTINVALDGSLPGGATLAMKDITAPRVSPFTWSAKYNGKKVELGGFVPSTDVAKSVAAAAKAALPGAEIVDNQLIGSGAPEGFENITGYALQQLPRFTSGKVSLSDLALSVTGVANSSNNYTAALGALGAVALPAGLAIAKSNIVPSTVSPYVWGADYNGKGVVMSGFVPDDATRASVTSALKKALPSAVITDDMQIAAGAPKGFVNAARFGSSQLARFSSGSVSLSDRALAVKGIALSPSDYKAANIAISSGLPAGMTLASSNITPATVSPFTWGAGYSDGKVKLNGFIPNEEARSSILAATKKSLPNAAITDAMGIAAGAPDGFTNAARFSSNQLTRFSSGSVTLADRALTVKGVAKSSKAYKAAKIAISSGLPAGMSLASENIVPPTISPYSWSADYDGKKVVMSGFVPDDATRASVTAAIKKSLPNASITDDMQIAAGAPESFGNAARFSSNQLSRFSSGTVSLSDRALAVRGVALSSKDYKAAKIAVSGGLPADMTLASENIVPPTVSPYSWGADYDGKTVTLSGFVPGNASREKIVEQVRSNLPNAKIVDQMQIAAGAPATYDAAMAGAIAVLPRFSKGNVALSGLNLTVNGVGKTSGDYLTAESYVAGPFPGGVKLASSDVQPPANQGDYIWRATKEKNSIILTGLAPSTAVRNKIGTRTAALFPDALINNTMTIGTGASDNYQGNTDLGLDLLGGLSEGTAKISNETLTVDGTARTVLSYEETIESKGSLGGVIWPPIISPYNWSIDKGAEKAVISGFVPNRGQGNANLALAKEVLKKPVEDRQRVAGGAPVAYSATVAALINGVNKLDNSSANITGLNAFIQGRASSEEESVRIGREIGTSIPKNYNYKHRISYPLPLPVPVVDLKKEFIPAPVPDPVPVVVLKKEFVPAKAVNICLVNFPALFAGEKIQFDTARAVIKEASYPLLDRIASGLRECDTSVIEIGGHTDSRGRIAYNQGLSEARARAVMEYMITKAGVKGSSLVAKGYGELQPIAPNTRAERFKNRRIEFKLLEK